MFTGIRAALRGAKVAMTTPAVRLAYARLVAAMLLATVCLQAVGLWGVVSWIDVEGETWARVGGWVLRAASSIVVLLVSPVVALVVVNLGFPMLSESLFFAALARQAPSLESRLRARAGTTTWVSTGGAARRLLGFLCWTLLALLTGWIPIVGVVAGPLLQLATSARYASWELVLPYMERRGFGHAEQVRFVAEHRAALLGFGAVFAPVLAIPLLGPLAFGVAQAATACLVADVLEPASEIT